MDTLVDLILSFHLSASPIGDLILGLRLSASPSLAKWDVGN